MTPDSLQSAEEERTGLEASRKYILRAATGSTVAGINERRSGAVVDPASIVARIHALYDVGGGLLDSRRFADAYDLLIGGLAMLRDHTTSEVWKVAAAASRGHPVHERLLQDPLMAGVFFKPRGYAGDADTLDLVYGFRTADESVTPLGRALLNVSNASPIAGAVRARCGFIGRVIRELAGSVKSAKVVSVGCGHMRELHRLNELGASKLEVFGIDHDQATLDRLPELYTGSLVPHPIRGSVQGMITGKVEIPAADLIYATGLYDYLEDDAAVALSRVLVSRLSPGGTLIIVNLASGNIERACMEAAWDWWMVYRDVPRLASLSNILRAETDVEADFGEVVPRRVTVLKVRRKPA